MVRYTLGICAGLLAAAVAACVPPVEPPPAPTVSPPALVRAAEAVSPALSHPRLMGLCIPEDPKSFVRAIRVLNANYNPNRNAANYSPPTWSSAPFDQQKNLNITNDLENAFSNAPAFFRDHLCNKLDGIFISPAACQSGTDAYNCKPPTTLAVSDPVMVGAWGFRSNRPFHPDFRSTYISISAALWPGGKPALAFNDYQARLLRAFRGGSNATVGIATPNASWMTVLAAMAHELGHVRWATTTIKNAGGSSDFRRLQQCSRQMIPGSNDFFFAWQYPNDNFLELPRGRRWRDFVERDTAGGREIDHTFAPTLDDLKGANPNAALFALYQDNQPWASLFGAQTADEDFVETYVMYVLTGYSPAPHPANDSFAANLLKSMPLNVPGHGTIDLPDGLVNKRKSALQNKMSCIPIMDPPMP
jgi:hypothetical protein